MANRLLSLSARQVQKLQKAGVHGHTRIGSREVVGFGFNGQANYVDRTDFPMPAIRFKESTPDIQVNIQNLLIFCNWLEMSLNCLYFTGIENEGTARLEKVNIRGEESPVPCQLLSDIFRNEGSHRPVEIYCWSYTCCCVSFLMDLHGHEALW